MDPPPSSSLPSSNDNTTPAELDFHRDKRQKLMVSLPATFDEDAFYNGVDLDMKTDTTVQPLKSAYPENLPARCFNPLFTILVQYFSERLRFDVDELKLPSLFKERTEAKQLLHDSWKSGSYQKLSEYLLKYVRTPSSPVQSLESKHSFSLTTGIYPHEGLQRGKYLSSTVPWRTNVPHIAVDAAWNAPYQGSYHILLFNNLNKMVGRQPYKNICTFVQSSGTGKSRMVDEQAKLVYTLPINTRSQEGICPYPPPDKGLHSYLVRVSGRFENGKPQSQEKFAEMWRQRLRKGTYREDFYTEVVQSCTIPDPPMTDEGLRDLEGRARTALRHLCSTLDRQFKSTKRIQIMIYIDEAHELKGAQGYKDRMHTKLDILCSVLASFYEHPLFCLLLSTQSSLRFLIPPAQAAASGRAQRLGDGLLAPISETPFDCAPNIKVRPGVLRLENLADIHHLAKWGRPLWWSMLENRGGGMDAWLSSHQGLISTARVKLLCRHDIDTVKLQDVSPSLGLTAILDVLLTLDFEPTRDMVHDKWLRSVEHEAEMVANHMRIAYSVPQHRAYLRSGYPSEPLLAEAAAQQIHRFQSRPGNTIDVMADALACIVQRSWVNLSERGEVVARLLFIRAYMDGVLKEHQSSTKKPLVFSRGCGLITFINHLFTPERAKAILDSNPRNSSSELNTAGTLRKAFENSVVRFTHFAKGGDESVCTTEALYVAFTRGMAFICRQNQEDVDFIIPILLDKSVTLQESAMSAILVQVKRCARTRGGMAYAFSNKDTHLFPKKGDKQSKCRPYFVLIMELMSTENGMEVAEGEMEEVEEEQAEKDEEIFVVRPPKVRNYPDDIHPCFLTTTWGCSETLYKVVKGNTDQYRRVLASHDFLKEHSRQDSESLSAMMMLKPTWRYGEDSFHFTSSKVLRGAN